MNIFRMNIWISLLKNTLIFHGTVLEVIRFSLSENLAQNYAILPFQICIVEA